MKKLQSILCASLLTLAICSSASAGWISGAPGQISDTKTEATDTTIRDILGIIIWAVVKP